MFTKKTLLLAVLSLVLYSEPAAAQSANATITLPIGSVFEILVDGTDTNRQSGWVVKKDGEFVQAEKGSVLQTRFGKAGTYLVEGQTIRGNSNSSLLLTVVVKDDAPAAQTSGEKDDLVHTSIIFSEDENNLMLVKANEANIEQLLMDANIQEDTNGDGDPVNDNALRNTFFSKGKGSVYVWLPEVNMKTDMLFGARLNNGEIATQKITVGSNDGSEEIEEVGSENVIESEKIDATSYRFVLNVDESIVQTVPFVMVWQFGDGTQSMLDTPTHTYAAKGDYDVSVLLRSLQDGSVLVEESTSVSVTENVDVQTPSETPASENTETENTETNDSSLLGTIFTAFIVLLISLGIGALVVFLLAKFREKDLHEHFATAEEKLVSDTKPDTKTEPEPMVMPDDVIEADVAEEPNLEPEPMPEPEPAKVPSWLETSEVVEGKSASAKASADKEVVEGIEVVEGVEDTKKKEQKETVEVKDKAVVPDWLKPKEGTEVVEGKSASAKASADKEVVEGIEGAKAPVQPTPTPTPDPDPEKITPPWLQNKEVKDTEEVKEPTLTPTPTPPSPENMTKEEKERERKRRKRQRYRQNKKAREEAEGTSTSDTATVDKEEVKEPTPTPTPTPTPPSPEKVTPPWLQPKEASTSATAATDKKEAEEPTPTPTPTPTPKIMDIPPADDSDVKFVISADSVEEKPTEESSEDNKA